MAPLIQLTANVDPVLSHLDYTMDELETALFVKLSDLNNVLTEKIQTNLLGEVLNPQSGNLYDSVESFDSATGDLLEAGVTAGGAKAPYGVYHEEGGLGPYVITPKKALALAFYSGGKQGVANLIFAKSVIHPTIEKRPWFYPPTEEMAPIMAQELQQTMNEVIA